MKSLICWWLNKSRISRALPKSWQEKRGDCLGLVAKETKLGKKNPSWIAQGDAGWGAAEVTLGDYGQGISFLQGQSLTTFFFFLSGPWEGGGKEQDCPGEENWCEIKFASQLGGKTARPRRIFGRKLWPRGFPWCFIRSHSWFSMSQTTCIWAILVFFNNLSPILSIFCPHSFVWCVPRSHPSLRVFFGCCCEWDVKIHPRLDPGAGISVPWALFQLLSWQLPLKVNILHIRTRQFPFEMQNSQTSCALKPPKIILKGTHQRETLSKFPLQNKPANKALAGMLEIKNILCCFLEKGSVKFKVC